MDAHDEPRKPEAAGGAGANEPHGEGSAAAGRPPDRVGQFLGGAASRGGSAFHPERPSFEAGRPGPIADVAAAEVQPFSSVELKGACLRPHRIIECVLAGKERLMKNIEENLSVPLLAALLFLSGVLFAVPYGVVRPTAAFWKIATLYSGSLLICFPSLHIFSQYYGSRLKLQQSLALSLILSSVAGMFALGFTPIIWFIDFTTKVTPRTDVTPQRLSVFLLATSFALGVIHMARCLASGRLPARSKLHVALLGLWVCLLAFITYRMGSVLELLP